MDLPKRDRIHKLKPENRPAPVLMPTSRGGRLLLQQALPTNDFRLRFIHIKPSLVQPDGKFWVLALGCSTCRTTLTNRLGDGRQFQCETWQEIAPHLMGKSRRDEAVEEIANFIMENASLLAES